MDVVDVVLAVPAFVRKEVYVHCKAGKGRSAAIVYAWLLKRMCSSSSAAKTTSLSKGSSSSM